MGVSIQGYLKKEVSIFAIENFVKDHLETKTEIYQGRRILFNKDENNRYAKSIFVYQYDDGLVDQYPTDHTLVISMGGTDIEDRALIYTIVEEFGGWFQFSDSCDEEHKLHTEYGVYRNSRNPDIIQSDEEKLKIYIAKEFGFKDCNKIAKLVEEALHFGALGGTEIDEFLKNPLGK